MSPTIVPASQDGPSELSADRDRHTPWTVIVVDDERNIRRALELILRGEGYEVLEAGTAEAAGTALGESSTPIDLVILDLMLPGMSGLEWLAELGQDEFYRHIPVIVISGHATSEEAAQAIKLGAVDFFEKPLNRERVLLSVSKALEGAAMVRQLAELRERLGTRRDMIGDSEPMRRVYRDMERVAPTKAGGLISGQSGTGKELISRAIHRLSTRAAKPFLKVNCAAIPRDLIESALFGHERGAFTGAEGRKRGLFEQAHGGTLFLDEIGDMDLEAQAKVLRVLQSGEVNRVGSEHTFHVDVRVLAATNKDLQRQVASGRFREDLYFRLNVFPIRCPTLEERTEDIRLLADHFMSAFCDDNGLKPKPIDESVYAALERRKWPGNVRELKNVVERAVILSGDEITIADLPEDPHVDPFDESAAPPPVANRAADPADGPARTLREVRDQAERGHIVQTLVDHDWNVSRAAVALGVERTNLHKKIRAYGIRRGEGTR
ncbi:MAG: sigma-54-dependent Fis family transcriptional regulator [Deltaproteobacteria bacterium]|jgi:DNA-binding NtrC family response regulator|nr:sigma-54-dependent Fis family transcriptional regulator [Deltaproteobacteria bacterium]MBW2534390.1 sigma-54-dependent Fis family transcriptional regulator [Deltaproteobacteria bacterium]